MKYPENARRREESCAKQVDINWDIGTFITCNSLAGSRNNLEILYAMNESSIEVSLFKTTIGDTSSPHAMNRGARLVSITR